MAVTARRSTARVTVAVAGLAGVVLLVSAPAPAEALRELRATSSAAEPTGPLVAAVALLAWLLAAWLLLTVLLTLLSRVPGGLGQAAAATVRRTAPAAVRRLLGVALGVGVVAGTLSAGTAAADSAPPPASAPAAGASLDWPAVAATDLDWPVAAPPTGPGLDWPTAGEPRPAAVLGAVGSAPVPDDTVVVQPGDSLWELAERRLAEQQDAAPTDAQVAAAWPAWWSANREAVGDDPDLLRPGTALQPPDPADGPDPS